MKWFSEKRTINSTRNGTITVKRNLGNWEITHANVQLTGDRLTEVLKQGLEAVSPSLSSNASVLLLGLGGGGILKDIYRLIPLACITAVEYDPLMISLAKEMKLYAPHSPPKIIEGDAGVVISELTEKFDLIIVDLFYEFEPSSLLLDENFVQEVKNRISPQGRVVVNVFVKKEYLEIMTKKFGHSQIWKSKGYPNYLGAFWN